MIEIGRMASNTWYVRISWINTAYYPEAWQIVDWTVQNMASDRRFVVFMVSKRELRIYEGWGGMESPTWVRIFNDVTRDEVKQQLEPYLEMMETQ